MSDNVAGAAAWLGGTEIVNDSRTAAYMQNGIKPGSLSISGDCGCSNVLALSGCDTEYTTPAEDNAPWYDPAIPESAEFAGFMTTGFEGLASTYTRSITESIADGATLGRSRFGSRTLTWKGFLFGSSCCGVAYGLRWLGKTLQGSNSCGNNCFGEDLELLVCCPSMEAALGYGPSIICNGDFDSSASFWTPTGDTALSWTNDPVHFGPGSLKTVNPIGGEITFSTGGNRTSDCPIFVTAGRTYKLSLYIKGALGADSEGLDVTFNWYNGLDVSLSSLTSSNIVFDSSSDWTLAEVTVTAPVNASTLGIDFVIGDAGTPANQAHYFDEVKLNQINYAPVVEPFRTIKGVSLLEGPLVTSERKMGTTCGGRCGGSTAIEIEFSLIGSQPWLYSAPIPVVNCVKVADNAIPIIGSTLAGNLSAQITDLNVTATSTDFSFLPVINYAENTYITLDPNSEFGPPETVLVTSHTLNSTTIGISRAEQQTFARLHPINTFWVLQTDCAPANCGAELEFIVPGCDVPVLPPTSSYVGCPVPDINSWNALYITTPRNLWNSVSEVVPVITIQTGSAPLVGARIGFYTSSDGNPCGDLFNNPPKCDLICDTINIRFIPQNSKFYIDGRTKKMSLVCGTNAVFAAEPYTLGPFSWPTFDCYGFCLEFAFDPVFMSSEACVSLSLVPRTTL